MVVIVLGFPGSGKSYFASRLARRLQAKYVSSDKLRRRLFSAPQYTDEEKGQVYEAMLQEMVAGVQAREEVVLDATFYKEALRRRFVQKAAELGQAVSFIEVQAEDGTIRRRVVEKRPDSDADYSVYEIVKGTFEPLQEEHLVLQSMEGNVEAMLMQALEYLEQDDEH